MTHNSKSLRPWLGRFAYPMPVYPEKGDAVAEYCTEKRLKYLIEQSLISGHGPRNHVRRLRFTVNERRMRAMLRVSTPDELRNLPVVGDPLKMLMLRTKRSIRAIRPL